MDIILVIVVYRGLKRMLDENLIARKVISLGLLSDYLFILAYK